MALISSLFLMFLISSFNPNTYHLYSITYPLVLGYSIALSRLTPESCTRTFSFMATQTQCSCKNLMVYPL